MQGLGEKLGLGSAYLLPHPSQPLLLPSHPQSSLYYVGMSQGIALHLLPLTIVSLGDPAQSPGFKYYLCLNNSVSPAHMDDK